RPQDRRTEGEIAWFENGVVLVTLEASAFEGLDQLRERRDAEGARQVIVERRDRLAIEDGVVRPPRIRGEESATNDLEVEPGSGAGGRGGEPPRGTGRAKSFANVADPHRRFIRRAGMCR